MGCGGFEAGNASLVDCARCLQLHVRDVGLVRVDRGVPVALSSLSPALQGARRVPARPRKLGAQRALRLLMDDVTLTPTQAALAACLVTLDEGTPPLSGREVEAVVERRRAQMAFVRAQAAEVGRVSLITDDDWAAASLWVQVHLPDGYTPLKRPVAAKLLEFLPPASVRAVLAAVSAVLQWDGIATDGERAWLDALARAARLDDRASLEDLLRAGKRLARGG